MTQKKLSTNNTDINVVDRSDCRPSSATSQTSLPAVVIAEIVAVAKIAIGVEEDAARINAPTFTNCERLGMYFFLFLVR